MNWNRQNKHQQKKSYSSEGAFLMAAAGWKYHQLLIVGISFAICF